jgi:predicted nucleotidyltransferase
MDPKIPAHIQTVLAKIFSDTSPLCIFLYGSMSRNDSVSESDYEIGVIYRKNLKTSRSILATYHQLKNLKIYPFSLEDLQNNCLDTPFPRSLYLLQLIDTAKVLFGENVFKNINKPILNSNDLVETVAFSLGRAYAAVVSSRQEDTIAVIDNLTKSFFYGLQTLIFIKTRKVIYSYRNLRDIDLPSEYLILFHHVFAVRSREVLPDTNLLYQNISFLNKFIMPLARQYKQNA